MKMLQERNHWKFNFNKVTIIDNFFTPQCLDILKYRVLYAKHFDTIYKTYQAIDYRGNQDYITNLIVKELKNKLNLLPFFQRAWSFVYDNESPGVDLHCDPSELNMNVWVSSDESIKDKSKNGLNIYELKPPRSWNRSEWNTDPLKIKAFIVTKKIKPIKIDYKSNRAVIFNGAYFHSSNGVSMKEGAENKRVSYTLLFGSQLE